jgi:bifunctional UDP-N-acetylglucosamine pyrophosphorylase/glucosamine-1-phosphate N-acetyltransferase
MMWAIAPQAALPLTLIKKGASPMQYCALVLAAGEGTRMKSAHSKVTHTILGKPLVAWAVDAAREAGATQVCVVVGHNASEVQACFVPGEVTFVTQEERLGTGHAVRVALEAWQPQEDAVVILSGDSPLVTPESIRRLVASVVGDTPTCAVPAVKNAGEPEVLPGRESSKTEPRACAASVLTMCPPDPTGYGRMLLDEAGEVLGILEHKDASEQQRELLRECNSGVYAFATRALMQALPHLTCENAAGEYYLTDVLALLREAGLRVVRHRTDDPTELLGVNSRAQLAEATRLMQARINRRLMDEGVTMLAPDLVWVEPGVTVERDTVLMPLTFLQGNTHIASDCVIGPNSRLTNVTVGAGCTVEETVAVDCVLDEGVTAGPRAYLRPGTHMCAGSKAGTHVEIKNSTIGAGSKVPHLSYIGDTTMGAEVNVGAGSITCNYDGVNKNATHIGDGAFIGSDTMMVAPVSIGEHAVTGASSCITKDVPAHALALERSQQICIEGYRD